MINKAKTEIRRKMEVASRKIVNGVGDFSTYIRLVGEHKAYEESLNIINEISKLDEDDDDADS